MRVKVNHLISMAEGLRVKLENVWREKRGEIEKPA